MSLVGNLADLGLGEILQIVSLSRKSGVLSLQSNGREAKVYFRQGLVVRASSTAFPVNLCRSLLAEGIVDRATLDLARGMQQAGGYRQRLGEILVQKCRVDPAALEKLEHSLVEKIAFSLFAWHEGTFDFELQDNLDALDDLRTDTFQVMLHNGLNAQFLAMEGARIIDETMNGADRQADSSDLSPEESVDLAFELRHEPLPEPEPVEPAMPGIAQDSHPRIMLVDDDDAVRDYIAAVLKDQGFAVCCHGKGEDALIAIDNLYRAGERPLLVVDLIMPRMDGTGLLGGLELLELVRANFPDLSVLVLSDHQNADAVKRLGELGYAMIIKPDSAGIGNPSLCRSFIDRLLRKLDNLGGNGKPADEFTVNIGDELRMEMGEEVNRTSTMEQSTGISLLRTMLEELNNPALGGGIILLVLRFAAEFMARAVIFSVRREEIVGLGQFGIEDGEQSADVRVRGMRIPCQEKTVFRQVVESQLPVKLHLDDGSWSRYLLDHLGGTPAEAFIGPIVSEGRVVALLYGDNGDERRPIGDTDSLEIFLSQAGVAMEKAILQQRLKERYQEVL